MLGLIICGVLIGLLLQVLYKLITKNNDFFTKNGIKFPKPYLLFGNSGEFIFRKKNVGQFVSETYAAFPTEKWEQ